jgi:hypothetical protein
MKKLYLNNQLKALKFNATVNEILAIICPGSDDKINKLELTYKRKAMPQIQMQQTPNGQKAVPTIFNPYCQPESGRGITPTPFPG